MISHKGLIKKQQLLQRDATDTVHYKVSILVGWADKWKESSSVAFLYFRATYLSHVCGVHTGGRWEEEEEEEADDRKDL